MTAEEYVVERIRKLENENRDLEIMIDMEHNRADRIEKNLQDVLKMFTFIDGGTASNRFKFEAWEAYDKKQYERIKELMIENNLFDDHDEKPEKEAESA